MHGRAELSAMAEMHPGARKHEGEEMGPARKLTAIMSKRSAARGRSGVGGTATPISDVRRKKTTAGMVLWGFRRHVGWWRRRGRRGGSSGSIEEARGAQWAQLWRAAATTVLGPSRGRAGERRGGH